MSKRNRAIAAILVVVAVASVFILAHIVPHGEDHYSDSCPVCALINTVREILGAPVCALLAICALKETTKARYMIEDSAAVFSSQGSPVALKVKLLN